MSLKIFFFILAVGTIYNIFKIIQIESNINFLVEYSNKIADLYKVLTKEKEYDGSLLAFLSLNSIKFEKLVPEETNFPSTNERAVQMLLNNFDTIYCNTYGQEKALALRAKSGILNSIYSQVGALRENKKKCYVKFIPIFCISNCLELFFSFLKIHFSFTINSSFGKFIGFIADVISIIGTTVTLKSQIIAFFIKG